MRPPLAILCIASLLPSAAALGDEVAAVDGPVPAPKRIPAIAALPDGSELDRVILPRYDEQLRLTGSLRAEKLILVDASRVMGQSVSIALMDAATGRPTLRVDLGSAILNQETGVIRADEAVTVVGERFDATGSALHFAFEEGRGFVSGPATTTIHAPVQTAMIPPTSSGNRSRPLATAALGIAMAATPLAASPGRPQPLNAEELAELERVAAPLAGEAAAAAAEGTAAARETRETSEAISGAARAFLINNVPEAAEAVQPDDPAPAAPLEIEPGPQDTRIECDGGFYFDAEANILVYLKNVRVTDPRFTLTGVDELKVVFAKKAEEAAPAEGDEKPDDLAAGFAAGVGEVERVIATGRVRFDQTQPQEGKPPVEASGALFNYDITAGEIVISGGYPWVRQGNFYSRALEPTLSLRIKRDGSFVTEGQWDNAANLQRNR